MTSEIEAINLSRGFQGFPRFRQNTEVMQTKGKYVRIGEAALLLEVTTKTLRNWDKLGKLEARRHPINGYRIYLRTELEALMQESAARQFVTPET